MKDSGKGYWNVHHWIATRKGRGGLGCFILNLSWGVKWQHPCALTAWGRLGVSQSGWKVSFTAPESTLGSGGQSFMWQMWKTEFSLEGPAGSKPRGTLAVPIQQRATITWVLPVPPLWSPPNSLSHEIFAPLHTLFVHWLCETTHPQSSPLPHLTWNHLGWKNPLSSKH